MISSPNFRGIVAMVLAMGVFIAGDSASKLALARTPLFEFMAIRGCIGSLLCLFVVHALGQQRHLTAMLNPFVLARGGAEIVANFGFTVAVVNMPIADLTAIAQTAPLLIILGAALFFGEKLGWSRLVLIALGLSGAMLVAQPGASSASPYAAVGFLVAIAATCRDLVTRKVPAHVPAPVAALVVLCCLTLASAVCTLMFETPVLLAARDFGLAMAAGIFMVAGNIGIFLAYRWGEARTIAPFMYSLTVWSMLSGLMLFGERPNALAVLGIVLIVLAGIMVIYVDRRRGQ